jgi:hypothetical protein
MPSYVCSICDYTTQKLYDFNRHNETKKHRNNIKKTKKIAEALGGDFAKQEHNEQKIKENEHKLAKNEQKKSKNEHFCIFCYKTFSTKATKRRHELHYCREIKPENLEDKITRLEQEKLEWVKEKEELYKKIDALITKVGNTYNTQININSYGSEDISHITNNYKLKLLKTPYGAIPSLIEHIHFNNEYPENQNIIVSNKKENVIRVYEGNKWVFKEKRSAINDLIDSKYFIIDNFYDNGSKYLSSFQKKNYEDFRGKYDENDPELMNNLKKNVEITILNNRK